MAAGKTGKFVNAKNFDTDYVLRKGTPLEFFARVRPNDRIRRFLAAFTISTGQSERAKEESDPGDRFGDTYSATFDPQKFLLTSDRVLTAYQ